MDESEFESRVVWPKACHLTIPTGDPNPRILTSSGPLEEKSLEAHLAIYYSLLLIETGNMLEKDSACNHTKPQCGRLVAWESSPGRPNELPLINIAP